MPEQVPFIGREDELDIINKLIGERDTLRFLCIEGPGGIGKTRLLQEVRNKYSTSDNDLLTVTDIIDFDDISFHVPINIGRKIAQMLDETIFRLYIDGLIDYRKMEIAGISSENLKEAYLKNNRNFTDCFNKISTQRRVVLFFDTIDALNESTFLDYILGPDGIRLKNVLILIAGRDLGKICKSLQSDVGKNTINVNELSPLTQEQSEKYLEKKEEFLHIRLEPDLAKKMILLAGGRPILIDLAIEWLARNIPLDWLIKNNLQELESLPENDLKAKHEEFERQLVLHIAQTRSQINRLILLLVHVYPLDVKMMVSLLKIEKDKADKLLASAKTYIFVKTLPDGRINLHDVMRDMINDYVLSESDPERYRRLRFSQFVADYLKNTIEANRKFISEFSEQEKVFREKKEVEQELNVFTSRMVLEHQIYILKAEYLRHALFMDIEEGMRFFVSEFDEAGRKDHYFYRKLLLDQIEKVEKKLPFWEQLYIFKIRLAKHSFEMDKYSAAKSLCNEILKISDISYDQEVETLICLGNAEIRLGSVKNGISDFEKASDISEKYELPLWNIKAKNALGWAYRLAGNSERAEHYYMEARSLYLKQDEPSKLELAEDYGLILNNLGQVLSYKDPSTAISITRSAIQHWKMIGNNVGMGAAHLVLGIAYHQIEVADEAFKQFEKALKIFEPLKINDWLGHVYSWRGALHYDKGDYANAERDLQRSLEIGSENIKPMTLTRQARVCIAKKDFKTAKEKLNDAIKSAQNIPDYFYWLSALGRLTVVAAKEKEYEKFPELERNLIEHLEEHRNNIKKTQEVYEGIAYIGLARLAFQYNKMSKKNIICKYLKKGIPLVIDRGFYGGKDISDRLAEIQEDFLSEKTDAKLIKAVGKELNDHFSEKKVQDAKYGIVTPIMYTWANWGKDDRELAQELEQELEQDYGWILNNPEQVLSYDIKEILTVISVARSAIQHWKVIGNNIGVGAAHHVLGMAYHQLEVLDAAFNEFQKASEILKANDRLGQVYSWRGALYYDRRDYANAERDLQRSLEIGSENIKPMTLTRLARVCISKKDFKTAQEKLNDAIKSAREIPDYFYWLSAIGRLTVVAAEQRKYGKFYELKRDLNKYLKEHHDKIKKPQKVYEGIAYIGLARLAFQYNKMSKKDTICEYLKKGMPLVIDRGFYGGKDISDRLGEIEKDFSVLKPELIHSVGKELRTYFSEKEIQDVRYGIITPIMYTWANWEK